MSYESLEIDNPLEALSEEEREHVEIELLNQHNVLLEWLDDPDLLPEGEDGQKLKERIADVARIEDAEERRQHFAKIAGILAN